MLVIGLTGDVGGGKSSVALLWEKEGAHIVDADKIVRELWHEPEIIGAAVARWGSVILDSDGSVRPQAVARLAFSDVREYRWLCDLIHPKVMRRMERAVFASNRWVVAEIPLLFEVGVPWWVDFVVYVTAPPDERLARLSSARGWGEEELRGREAYLLPREEKIRSSHWVIENDGTPEELRAKAAELAEMFSFFSEPIEVTVSCGSEEEARRLSKAVIDRRKAACVHVYPIESLYWWKGNIEEDHEWEISFKTVLPLYPDLVGIISKEHSYEVPVINMTSVVKANRDALLWLWEELSGEPDNHAHRS
jgi:dephospho-CoA kinase